MDSTLILGFIGLILGSNVLTALLTGFFNRRLNNANAISVLTEASLKLVNESQEQLASLQTRINNFDKTLDEVRKFHFEEIKKLKESLQDLQDENNVLVTNLENKNFQLMELKEVEIPKLQYAITIISDQVISTGHIPVLDLSEIQKTSLEDLARSAKGIHNANERKKRALERKRGDQPSM